MLFSFHRKRLKYFYKFISDKNKQIKILVLRNGRIGDIVFITPVLNRLIRTFPNAYIDVAVSENSLEVLCNFHGLRNVISIKSNLSLLGQVIFYLGLRKHKYDIVLNQEVNSHYTLMGRLINPKFQIGFENKAEYLLDIVVLRKGHAVKAEQGTVETWTVSADDEPTLLFTTEKEDIEALKLLKDFELSKDDFLICFNVGCSEENSIRQLSADKIGYLADQLVDKYNAKIIFTGTDKDKNETNRVMNLMKKKSISLVGKTPLRLLISLIKYFKIIIGPDTGTLHLANAVGTPVVMYMGWADPYDTGPYDISGHSKIVNVKLPCLPCKHKNPKPQQWEICKNIRPTLCMQLIEVKQLMTAVEEIIKLRYNYLFIERN